MPEIRVPVLLAASGLAVVAASAAMAQSDPLGEPFPAVLELSDVDGVIGFALHGFAVFELSGAAVRSAGDVNGDGIADLVIGAPGADPRGRRNAGSSYVVFGDATGGFLGIVALGDLNGADGFRLDGAQDGAQSGIAVAGVGDINGDGVDDLIIGSPGSGLLDSGRSHVIFGRDTASAGGFPAAIDLATLDGTIGFELVGERNDQAGFSVASAGDVNGDGMDDLIIGARYANAAGRTRAGRSYVVFGQSTVGFPALIELATIEADVGFRIEGIDTGDRSGVSVATAGDVNGDGLDDLVIGANGASPGDLDGAGSSFVVFGRDAIVGFPAVLGLAELDGAAGFRMDGALKLDDSGRAVASAGDVNGDGFGDVIIGAPGADAGAQQAGSSYVVFGRDASTGFPATLQLANLDGTYGFRINGAIAEAFSGSAVASAGDIDGDRIDDLVIGSPKANPAGRSWAGSTHVVYGREAATTGGFPAVLSLGDMDPAVGFRLDGGDGSDQSGCSVAPAGDVNGDGMADLVIGAFTADPGIGDGGKSYIVYGRNLAPCAADLDADGALTIFDFLAFQNLFDATDPRADFDGDGDFTIFDFLAFQNAFDAGCP